ncbi:MAG TPA: putative quinol monooxygenase [Terracidiphilus sp.]|nr:putative quinol monooxygenase [Terracidiphilus sp.]
MISFMVRMKFAPEDRVEVDEMLRKLAEASRQEPGCRSYVPHRVEGDPEVVVIYEQYADKGAEEAHRKTTHFKKYAVGGLYQKMLERSREDLSALV